MVPPKTQASSRMQRSLVPSSFGISGHNMPHWYQSTAAGQGQSRHIPADRDCMAGQDTGARHRQGVFARKQAPDIGAHCTQEEPADKPVAGALHKQVPDIEAHCMQAESADKPAAGALHKPVRHNSVDIGVPEAGARPSMQAANCCRNGRRIHPLHSEGHRTDHKISRQWSSDNFLRHLHAEWYPDSQRWCSPDSLSSNPCGGAFRRHCTGQYHPPAETRFCNMDKFSQ